FTQVASFPYDAVKQPDGSYDRDWAANDFAIDRATFLSDGIFANPSDNFQVKAQNMNVTVGQTAKPNSAFIQGHSFFAKGQLILGIPAASTQYARIDTVTLRHSSLPGVRNIDVYYNTGTPSATPAAPALIRNADQWEIQLAQISVAANARSISQSNILDTRLNTSLCGIVTYLGQQVDTTAIFTQYQNYLNQKIADWNALWNTTKTNQDAAWNAQMADQAAKWLAQYNAESAQFANWFGGAQTDLVLAAQFYFDNTEMMPGTTYKMTQSADGNTITELLTKTAGGTKIAQRVTTATAASTTEVFTLWQSNGTTVQLSTTKTVTFNADGSVTETVA
ncbi:MAG: hypothetical protein FWF44_00080, partial [Defluviitaleaceae bacterium]|nr:hypothetical protein [Defluviitaleaceae bacterium]